MVLGPVVSLAHNNRTKSQYQLHVLLASSLIYRKDQRLRTKDTGGRRSVEVSATGGEDNREMSEMDTKDNKASQPDKGNDIPEPPVVGWMVIGHEWELHIGIWNIDETRIVRTAPGSEDLKTTALTTTRGSIVHLSFGERLGIYWVY